MSSAASSRSMNVGEGARALAPSARLKQMSETDNYNQVNSLPHDVLGVLYLMFRKSRRRGNGPGTASLLAFALPFRGR